MKLDHINIVTSDLDAAVKFFDDIMGMKVGPRPNFSSNGAWFYGDEGVPAPVHLNINDETDGPTGNMDHIAFKGDDFDGLLERLTTHGFEYVNRVVPGSGVRQVFFMSPFGIKFEVDFDPETPA